MSRLSSHHFDGSMRKKRTVEEILALTPDDELTEIVEVLNATKEPDEDLISDIGVGALENLLQDSEAELWDRIEALARGDARFRTALAQAWAVRRSLALPGDFYATR